MGSSGRSERVRKISPPTGIRSPDRPPRSESLYRLSYPSPLRSYGCLENTQFQTRTHAHTYGLRQRGTYRQRLGYHDASKTCTSPISRGRPPPSHRRIPNHKNPHLAFLFLLPIPHLLLLPIPPPFLLRLPVTLRKKWKTSKTY